jgi:hypothetical protein
MRTKIAVVLLAVFCMLVPCTGLLLAANSIALKVVAVNPSKDLSQKVQVRAFLPKEVKPEDIIDKGDLNISYDTQQGSYFVFNEYELKPEESMERTIEIRDIWNIPDAEIASALQEADKMTELLKNTEFQDRAKFLLTSIQDKLKKIQENQANPAPNPDRHISDYRDNAKIFETVKTDMAMIRSFLSLAKPLPPIVIWRAIVIIMFFLGGLGVAFYFIWQKQLKQVVSDDTFYVPGKPQDKPK